MVKLNIEWNSTKQWWEHVERCQDFADEQADDHKIKMENERIFAEAIMEGDPDFAAEIMGDDDGK